MSTLHRLKAYFGMVPADELDDFGRYAGPPPVEDDEYVGYAAHPRQDDDEYDSYRQRQGGRQPRWNDPDRGRDSDRGRDYDDYYGDEPDVSSRRPAQRRSWATETTVRGALAVDPAREHRAIEPPAAEHRPAEHRPAEHRPAEHRAFAARSEDPHPMSRITTLHPRNYNEARTIGEHYRDGIPVIMNLTAMEDADAKRLVDFAAGLAFALRGSIDKVTTKVFLISPADVDVTAEDKRRIAEGNFLPSQFKHA